MISTYSFALSIILFNLALVLVFLLRRKRYFIARYGIQVLILIVALGIIRLFSPVDGQFPHVIRSHKVIPAIRSALGYGIFGSQITVGKILLAVWLGGTAVFLIRDVCLILRFKWQRAGYTECNNEQVRAIAKELGITKPLVITPCVPMPHVAGHFRQVIYVPPLELSEEDWKYVLKHEMQHVLAHDQQIKLFFLFLRALFWWNPVSQLFIKELDAILELRCDDQVCAKLSEDEQVSYFGAMLKVMRQIKPDNKRAVSAVTGLVGGQSANRYNIKQRYEVYANSNQRLGKLARGIVSAFICAVFIASYFVIVQPAYTPPEEDLVGSEMVIENNVSFIVFNGVKYTLFVDSKKVMEIDAEQLKDEPYCNFQIYEVGE